MKTTWFFGDSFTQSMINDNPQYKKIIGKTELTWNQKLSIFLNSNHKNFGKGGNSPQGIIDDFISNMNKFEPGDTVIISSSPMVRTLGYDDGSKKITTWNLETIQHHPQAMFRTNKDNFGTPLLAQNNKDLVLDYLLTFLLPYEDEWHEYFEGKIKQFIELFKKQDIHVYYWTHKLWDNYTSITKETNRKLIDDHWGWIGQNEFLEYLKKRINERKYFCNIYKPSKRPI
jgi:hypothetical protein